MWVFGVWLLLVDGTLEHSVTVVASQQACVRLMDAYGNDFRDLKPGTGRLVSCRRAG